MTKKELADLVSLLKDEDKIEFRGESGVEWKIRKIEFKEKDNKYILRIV